MTAGWIDDQIAINVVLDRPREPVERIAASFDAFVRSFATRVGQTDWVVIDGPAWVGPPTVLTEIVRARPSTAATGDPDPEDGYGYTLYAKRGATTLAVGVSVGGPLIGRRLPQLCVRGRITNPRGIPVDAALADALLEALVEGWEPLFASMTTGDINRAAGRGRWRTPAGYRVWLRDGTVSLTWLAAGVSARSFAGGTLVAVPDTWPPDLVAQRLDETYERNGADEVPH